MCRRRPHRCKSFFFFFRRQSSAIRPVFVVPAAPPTQNGEATTQNNPFGTAVPVPAQSIGPPQTPTPYALALLPVLASTSSLLFCDRVWLLPLFGAYLRMAHTWGWVWADPPPPPVFIKYGVFLSGVGGDGVKVCCGLVTTAAPSSLRCPARPLTVMRKKSIVSSRKKRPLLPPPCPPPPPPPAHVCLYPETTADPFLFCFALPFALMSGLCFGRCTGAFGEAPRWPSRSSSPSLKGECGFYVADNGGGRVTV